jgi:hypothetical protein
MGLIYNDIELLVRCRIISMIHLELFKRCWIGGIEYLLSIIIKKIKN